MRGESILAGIGSAEIIPCSSIIAGSKENNFTIIYTVGKLGLKKDGGIRVDIPYGFTAPQVMYPGYPGYIKSSTNKKEVKLTSLLFDTKVKRAWGMEYWITEGKNNVFKISFWAYQVFIKIDDGELKEGDKIEVEYGSSACPIEKGTVDIPSFCSNFEFTVAVDVDGKRNAPLSGYYLIKNSPILKVIGDKTEKIDVCLPSIINTKLNKQISIKIVPRDKYGNLSEFEEAIKINNKKYFLKKLEDIKISTNKLSNFSINLKNNKIPINITPFNLDSKNEYFLYWGDLHAHTKFSDGLGTPEEYYEFAKKISCLDFAAISDHSGHFSNTEWEQILKVNNQYNQSGEFVTLHGFEFNIGGDKNVYDLYEKEALSPCKVFELNVDNKLQQEKKISAFKKEFDEFKDILKKRKSLVIHHQHNGPLSKEDYDSEIFRLVEIYSIWGNAEYVGCPRPIHHTDKIFIQDYLSYGWKLGFTGGSDCHAGHPGYSNWLRRRTRYHNGLTAVYAKELTREAIWEALWNRRCYATTGSKIIVDFRINNEMMGAEIKLSTKNTSREINAKIKGTGVIDKIELIKNNNVILTKKGKYEIIELNFIDKTEIEKEDFYYVRVTQKDGEIAWSSPIWVS